MHVLLTADRFATTGADLVAPALAAGWAAATGRDTCDVVPLDDGGAGLVAAVHAAAGGERLPLVLPDASGAERPVTVLRLADGTVVVEAAQLLGAGPTSASRSLGTGDLRGSARVVALLRAAYGLSPRRVVIGLGGLAAHDAGAGLLVAWRRAEADVGALDVPARVLLEQTAATGLGAVVEAATRELSAAPLVVAVDTEVPLLGLHGASASLAVADAAAVTVPVGAAQDLERAVGAWVTRLGAELGPGRVRAAASERGAGAGGGLAFALGLLGGRLTPGSDIVADLVGLDARVAAAELVVHATPQLDPHTLHDSPLAAVVRAAERTGVPVVVVTGEQVLGRREAAAQGLAGVYPLVDDGAWTDAADLLGALAARAARVSRTWSR